MRFLLLLTEMPVRTTQPRRSAKLGRRKHYVLSLILVVAWVYLVFMLGTTVSWMSYGKDIRTESEKEFRSRFFHSRNDGGGDTMIPPSREFVSSSKIGMEDAAILASKLILGEKTEWPACGDAEVGKRSNNECRLTFAPGTLKMRPEEAFRNCVVDSAVYQRHLDSGWIMASLSKQHNLAYILVPKSGSSTSRWIMAHSFNAKEIMYTPSDLASVASRTATKDKAAQIPPPPLQGYETITFVRDPLDRFLSSYDEIFVRTAPWAREWMNRKHPFPFIHEGMHNYDDYEDVFCPPNTRTRRGECSFRETHENGTLSLRFERFVKEYDGLTPFDVHLYLQVPLLWAMESGRGVGKGKPVHVDFMYNTSVAKMRWVAIAEKRNVTLPDRGEYKGRSYPRRFNVNRISDDVKRRICKFAALDYCCLNLKLPHVCQDAVSCTVEQHHSSSNDGENDNSGEQYYVGIKPVSHPS